MKKILYVADEGIGNTIMATPVVSALREVFPNAHITFGSRSYYILLSMHPTIKLIS